VGEQVGYIAKVWLAWADVAVQRDVGRHCSTGGKERDCVQQSESAVSAPQLVKGRAR
jgi:hypothetical protein